MTNSINLTANNNRIESIDMLRGIVMIIMALDHVRDYFHFDSFLFSPTDIEHTTTGLFITRWITHLCAPTFIFLAGTSAYFITKKKSINNTSLFLVTRGIWLIILQLTLIRFAWNFDPLFHYNNFNIISAIGMCMVVLSALIHFRLQTIFIIGIVMVAGHNLLDGISFGNGTIGNIIWSLLHVQNRYDLGQGYVFTIVYPLIPWIGVMALGYCLGRLYDVDYSPEKRKKLLQRIGGTSLLIFASLRYINIYGDPVVWSHQSELTSTMMSFFNLEKYPPSLLYLAATLGISLLLLALLEKKRLNEWKPIAIFGKVSLFYYVLHLFVIHLLAMVVVGLAGYSWQSMIFIGPIIKSSPVLVGKYGFSLSTVYVLWVCIVVLLYPLCNSWNSLKTRNKEKWWVSYV